jgi:hypothetical protein
MPRRLRPAAMSLADLLTCFHRFIVPDYQRVYAWGEHQVSLLLSALEAAAGAENAGWLYLGTIYLAAAGASREAEIADGQQRILTANMLYAAGRDLAEDPAEAERLHSILLTPGADPDAPFRFVPRAVDAPFFRRWVQDKGATLCALPGDGQGSEEEACAEAVDALLSDSRRHIIANRDMIVTRLKELGSERRRRLFNTLEASTEIIAITAPTLDAARTAYASTQTRGLRQAETDKLKAELIGDCPRSLRARLAGLWEECEAILGQDNLAELMQHMIMVRTERKAQHALEVDLFRAFDLPKQAEAFIEDELVPSARAYRRICAAAAFGGRREARINGHLTTLLRTTHDGWKAPALLALRTLDAPDALEAALRDLERLATVLMIVGVDPNDMTARYVAVIRDIKAGRAAASPALRPTAAELAGAREYLREKRFAQRDRFRMPLLLKLNDLLARSVQVVDPRMVSCEHVLPRNVPNKSQWRELFNDPVRKRYAGGTYVHCLGNLAILTHHENRSADTLPFADKRAILKRSAFAISNDAARARAWTPEEVTRRTDRLAGLLIQHWRLNAGG